MSDSGENAKYKWTPESTALLVSVWSDKEVQKQFEYSTKPQLIWESVARYMQKKGYDVSARHCRSRMKQVLVCYREAKKTGTREGIEQYYESIDRVRMNKRLEQINVNGMDTVDSAVNTKSPLKDVKTNKNLQMRHKLQEPVESVYRTEALSPTWIPGGEMDYPDSPESNETVLARPYGTFSPTKDVAINTNEKLHLVAKTAPRIIHQQTEDNMINRDFQNQNLLGGYPYFEIPYQNTVQNVQNQIIQENMQQNLNYLQQNQAPAPLPRQNLVQGTVGYQQKYQPANQAVRPTYDTGQMIRASMHNPNLQILRENNHLQQAAFTSNQAMPQEPRKVMLEQNLLTNKQHVNTFPRYGPYVLERKQTGSLSPDYSSVSSQLNNAFCQTTDNTKEHNLNETYTQSNEDMLPETTVLTTNATINDDSFLMELLADSPTSSLRNEAQSKTTAVNTDTVPNVPLRKKKAQKLEQLMLSAISSQNDVVNKILAAQNEMVARFLDADRDRQNKLENRLDHLLNVVHAKVLQQSPEKELEIPPPPPEPVITSLIPPPKPGVVPPKLDLVPPKPCRVPCTLPSSNVELVNQNPVMTRPGVVSPIGSPGRKVGTIWSKLGPVSQSPFVKAQQRLGLQPTHNLDARTHSSAERRIAKEIGKVSLDARTVMFETQKFLEAEREMEEKIENARLELKLEQNLTARRRLFTQREPTAAMLLSAAFIEAECEATEPYSGPGNPPNKENKLDLKGDELLAGNGEGYDRLRQLDQATYLPPVPCETSTPAKPSDRFRNAEKDNNEPPRQTIQQLARLVMNSARWRNIDAQNQRPNHLPDALAQNGFKQSQPYRLSQCNDQNLKQNTGNLLPRSSYGDPENAVPRPVLPSAPARQEGSQFPIGFTTAFLSGERDAGRQDIPNFVPSTIGFVNTVLPDIRAQGNVRFSEEPLAELQRIYARHLEELRSDRPPHMISNGNAVSAVERNMIERYVREMLPKKQSKDGSDSEDEYLDTTMSMPPSASRKGSLTSLTSRATDNASSAKSSRPENSNCVIS